jgi:murein DD-endopeptidase MepM/ murein hydrolase activator NlpD
MKLQKPLDQWIITQKFGANPQTYKIFGLAGHDGIDLRTRSLRYPLGKQACYAAADGKVESVAWDRTGYGTHIRIRHTDKSLTIYGHLSKIIVAKGQVVKARQQIGITGNTGFSSGPHLHFEYRPAGWEKLKNGFAGAVDPLPFIV